VLPSQSTVDITSLLTVNDLPTADGYRMVGIPDGLGAVGTKRGVQLTMNHELNAASGIPRRHGQRGAFLSRYTIDPATLDVTHGEDLLDPTTRYWNYALHSYDGAPSPGQPAAFGRFCSSTLTEKGQLFNERSKRGFDGRVYLTGEEIGQEGRVIGVADDASRTAQQLPRLGLSSWENQVPAANLSDTTLVVGTEDGGTNDSEVTAYVGAKSKKGNGLDRAGLTSGSLTGVRVNGGTGGAPLANDSAFRAAYDKGTPVGFDLVDLNWDQSGAAQQAERTAKNVFGFTRVEDGHWDPLHPNDFYFVTTEGGEGTTGGGGGGLWRLRFGDIENPKAGGTLTLLLDGTEAIGLHKPDNVVIDRHGNLLIQEDPGNVPAVSRIVAYRIADGTMGVLAQFDRNLFDPVHSAEPQFLTQDEESSGIIDVEKMFGAGSFLFDAQVHTNKGLPPGTGPGTVEELVERGQLLVMRVQDFANVYAASTG
jgi:hypothetical protein